jgi:hypothetical protein
MAQSCFSDVKNFTQITAADAPYLSIINMKRFTTQGITMKRLSIRDITLLIARRSLLKKKTSKNNDSFEDVYDRRRRLLLAHTETTIT